MIFVLFKDFFQFFSPYTLRFSGCKYTFVISWNFAWEISALPAKIDPLVHARNFIAGFSQCTFYVVIAALIM